MWLILKCLILIDILQRPETIKITNYSLKSYKTRQTHFKLKSNRCLFNIDNIIIRYFTHTKNDMWSYIAWIFISFVIHISYFILIFKINNWYLTILLTLTSILNYHEKEKMKLQIHNRSIFSCMFLCFVVWALDTQNADYSNVDISKCNLSKKD